MADISKCKGEDCPRKYTCYRFTAPSSEYRQAWLGINPLDDEGNCEYYWKDEY